MNPRTEASCSYLVESFDEEITRGISKAALMRTQGKAEEAFEDVVTPALAAVEKHCKSGPDLGAFAAAATRLREAAAEAPRSTRSNPGALGATHPTRRAPAARRESLVRLVPRRP